MTYEVTISSSQYATYVHTYIHTCTVVKNLLKSLWLHYSPKEQTKILVHVHTGSKTQMHTMCIYMYIHDKIIDTLLYHLELPTPDGRIVLLTLTMSDLYASLTAYVRGTTVSLFSQNNRKTVKR